MVFGKPIQSQHKKLLSSVQTLQCDRHLLSFHICASFTCHPTDRFPATSDVKAFCIINCVYCVELYEKSTTFWQRSVNLWTVYSWERVSITKLLHKYHRSAYARVNTCLRRRQCSVVFPLLSSFPRAVTIWNKFIVGAAEPVKVKFAFTVFFSPYCSAVQSLTVKNTKVRSLSYYHFFRLFYRNVILKYLSFRITTPCRWFCLFVGKRDSSCLWLFSITWDVLLNFGKLNSLLAWIVTFGSLHRFSMWSSQGFV